MNGGGKKEGRFPILWKLCYCGRRWRERVVMGDWDGDLVSYTVVLVFWIFFPCCLVFLVAGSLNACGIWNRIVQRGISAAITLTICVLLMELAHSPVRTELDGTFLGLFKT